MKKILFEQFKQMMLFDVVANNACVEIEFCIDNILDYDSCWLGKTIDRGTNSEVFWYGLVADGSQAYDFNSFCEFANAKVFNGKSIEEIWSSITLLAIDACDVDWRLPFYLGLEPGPVRRPAEQINLCNT